MFRIITLSLASIGASFSLMLGAAPAQAVTRVCTENYHTPVNVRYQPSLDAEIATSLPSSVPVEVVGSKNGWYEVRLNHKHNPQVPNHLDGTYWIYGKYVCFNTAD